MAARGELNVQADGLRKQITTFEYEAQQLEQMEAELLRKLQDTQKIERDAFGRLEAAMVDASIPRTMRRGGATMFGGGDASQRVSQGSQNALRNSTDKSRSSHQQQQQ